MADFISAPTVALTYGTPTTSVGSPGSDANIPTEKAVRTAIAAQRVNDTINFHAQMANGLLAVMNAGTTFPYAMTITSAYAVIDAGTITIDLWVCPVANIPPTVANTITAGAPIAIAAGTTVNATVSTWTVAIPAGSAVYFAITAVNGASVCDVSVGVTHA